jgi:hypothetical protein
MRYVTLAFAMLLLTPLRGMAAPKPPVRVELSHDRLVTGERAKVYVQTENDGYLLVLRVDTHGNVRVLFPVNPTDDPSIRGGHKFEVRGRGDREAFTVGERSGAGMVLAAWADHPFNFAEFTTGDHWNAAAFAADSAQDPQAMMLGIVDQMADGHYDYDVVNYTVGAGRYRPGYAGWYGPPYGGWYGAWSPGWYGPWPWAPYYYGYGPRIGFGFHHGRR